MTRARTPWLLLASGCLLALLLLPGPAQARHARTVVLHVPATVRGFVGGESHDTYALAAGEGERLVVRIAWRQEADNVAEFSISASRRFDTAQPVPYGNWSKDGREWTGTMQRTGRMFIHVVAHPSAHYTLTIGTPSP